MGAINLEVSIISISLPTLDVTDKNSKSEETKVYKDYCGVILIDYEAILNSNRIIGKYRIVNDEEDIYNLTIKEIEDIIESDLRGEKRGIEQ